MTRSYVITVAGRTFTVEVDAGPERARVVVDGRQRTLDVRRPAEGVVAWLEGTASVLARVDGTGTKRVVTVGGHEVALEVQDARAAALAAVASKVSARPAGPAAVRAPMPGRVVKVMVKAGDAVKAGQGLVVVEAMKMENELKASRDGRVERVAVAEGAAVEAGAELVVVG